MPARRLTNDELVAEKGIDTTDEWIRSHTGIGSRYITDDETTSGDLAFEAAKNALAMAAGFAEAGGAEREAAAFELAQTLDAIIIATAFPDYIGCPSTACIVQHKLGARKALAFDVTAGCTGFAYGLEIAAGIMGIREARKRVLLIGAETLTKITNWEDRSSCILFGDGAGAVVLEKTDAPCAGEGRRGLVNSVLFADGGGGESLLIKKGGGRNPYKAGEVVDIPPHLYMNGQEVYNFAVKAVVETVDTLMKAEGLSAEDISVIIPHQANARIVQAARKRLHIPEEKFYLNIEEYANTSAASIPIALDEMNRGGLLKKGDLLLTVGFGAGLTYGGNAIVW